MCILNENEYKIFEQLTTLNQKGTIQAMSTFLNNNYKEVVTTSKYIYAIGDIPIALTAHMDTVFKSPPKNIYYDEKKNVIWSPEGLGADDRAGIFAIIKIIFSGFKPHIILTTDEERGALGASALVKKVNKPFADMKYIIQLDRRGDNDCVFYDCDNKEFVNYIEKFGFIENIGSFSDISTICPSWEVAGVNLSVGYRNEHSVSETLHITPFLNTVNKVIEMLKDVNNISTFKYVHNNKINSLLKNIDWNSINTFYKCHGCGTAWSEYELFPVKCRDGKKHFYCPDCIVDNVDWCIVCGQPFEVGKNKNQNICDDCSRGNKNV